MAYSAQADVTTAVGGAAKLVQLTAAPGAAVPDLAVMNQAIAEADGIINSYVCKRYAVPVTPTPDTLKPLSAKMAARVLRRNKTMALTLDAEDEITDRKWLAGVADGSISLGVEPPASPSSLEVDQAGARSSTKNVSREKLKGFW